MHIIQALQDVEMTRLRNAILAWNTKCTLMHTIVLF